MLAVYEAVREGVARARAGDGPTFVEAVTYRVGAARDRRRPEHLHRPRAGRGGARARLRHAYEGYLRGLGLLDDERAEAVRQEARAIMRAGIEAAEAEPPADPELVFAHAYAAPAGRARRATSTSSAGARPMSATAVATASSCSSRPSTTRFTSSSSGTTR